MATPKKTAAAKPVTALALTTVNTAITKAANSITEGLKETATLLEKPLSAEGFSAITAALKRWGKVVKSQEENAVGALKAFMKNAEGGITIEHSEDGTRELSRSLRVPFKDRVVVANLTFPRAKEPAAALAEALLRAKGLPLEVGCDQVVSYAPNKTKLETLLAKGNITQTEYDSLFPAGSPTLTVKEEVPS